MTGVLNRILSSLSDEDFRFLRGNLKRVELVAGDRLYEFGADVRTFYFIESGQVSLVRGMKDGRIVEVGATGTDGLTHTGALFGGGKSPFDILVQISGFALAIEREPLLRAIGQSRRLESLVKRYMFFAIWQIGQTAACNRLHTLQQRFARWLLMAHDNAQSDTFYLTQESLAMMLGSQRTGVTAAAHKLQSIGCLKYSRGRMTIIDRECLESTACECYQSGQHQLSRVFQEL